MPIDGWCGKSCCDCKDKCELDESIPCSPDCENLSLYGDFTDKCVDCEVFTNFVLDYILCQNDEN